MRRALTVLSAAAVAAGAGVAGTAVGQGTGGTVGEGAQGTLEITVRTEMKGHPNAKITHGINPAVPRDKKRPKVADLAASNDEVLIDGKVVGRVHHTEIVTFEGARKYKGKAVWVWRDMIDLGGGNLIFAACKAEDSPTNNDCAIQGGVGRYAGARGTAVVDFSELKEDKKSKTATVPVRFTFIP